MESKWIPARKEEAFVIETDSWFDMKMINNNDILNKEIEADKKIKKIKPKKKKKKKKKKPKTIMRAKKYEIFPTKEQKVKLDIWFDIYSKMYNKTNKLLKAEFDKGVIKEEHIKKITLPDGKVFKKLNTDKGAYFTLNILRRKLYDFKTKIRSNDIYAHTLDCATKQCLTSYKGSLCRFFKNNNYRFEIADLLPDREHKIFKLEPNTFTKNGFKCKYFGSMEKDPNLNFEEIKCESVILYDTIYNKYYIHVPEKVEVKDYKNRILYCGIDPGVRTFLTIYSEKVVFEIGTNCIEKLNPIIEEKESLYEQMNKINRIKSKANMKKIRKKYFNKLNIYEDKINELKNEYKIEEKKYLASIKNTKNIYTLKRERDFEKYKSNYKSSVAKYNNKIVKNISTLKRDFEKYKSNYKSSVAKYNNKIVKNREKFEKKREKYNTYKRKRTQYLNKNRKLTNMVHDLHFKIGKILCKKFKNIKLGYLKVKGVTKKGSKLHKGTKKILLALSHCKFRSRMTSQCEKYNAKLIEINEYMTTQTCSKCSKVNDVGSSKIYSCSGCKLKADRDVNAARNICNSNNIW